MDYIMKVGDIKINTMELNQFLEVIEHYQSVVFNNLDMVEEQEQKVLIEELDVYNNFITKYVVASDLRRRESLWFGLVEMINNQTYFRAKQETIKEINKDDLSIEDYMDNIKESLEEAQELPKSMNMLIGLAVCVYGFDTIKRAVWAEYIDLKTKRENAVALKGC